MDQIKEINLNNTEVKELNKTLQKRDGNKFKHFDIHHKMGANKMTTGLNFLTYKDKSVGSHNLIEYFFCNSFATCLPVSKLIALSFEIPPYRITIFFLILQTFSFR